MMDKDVFLNAPPQPLPFPWSGLTCNSDRSFLDSISSVDQHSHFESTLISMASSQAATSEAFALPPPAAATPAASLLSSSLQLPVLDQIDMPDLRRSVPLSPPAAVPSLAADPGFAERAARLSCFGSRSFNRRASRFVLHNAESTYRSRAPLMVNGRLQRVSSSPSLKQGGSPVQSRKYSSQSQVETRPAGGMDSGSDKKWSEISGSGVNSNEESSVSEQIPSGETGSKTSTELNSCKRKGGSRGNSAKGVEGEEVGNVKRSKPNGSGDEAKGGSNNEEEKEKGDQKAAEPPKDYIHVRARRGQATDSHSLAERVRREKISERMKLLQDLVPGCNKVTGKALMLDEIINYVKSLQRQVEFLSMKLASVNLGLDFNLENLVPKDMFQQNTALPHQMYPSDSALYHPQPQHNAQQLHGNDVSEAPLSQCPVNPVPSDVTLSYNLGVQLPCVDGFSEILPQFAALSEDDLHTIVQMGFAKNAADNLHAPNQTSSMKVER